MMAIQNQNTNMTEHEGQSHRNQELYERIYQDFKDMEIDITARVAEGVSIYVRTHDNAESVSSDIIAQWIDQRMEVDISPELETKSQFIQYTEY